MKKKSLNKPGMKINGNSFLLMVTVLLFIVMYAAGMVIFADKGFAKPQMFLNLFISNAGLLVIAMGQTIVMITGGIDISVGSVTALVCMLCAYDMEKKGMSAYMAVAIALLIGLIFGIVQWANYKIYLPIGSYSRRGKFIPAYIYPTVIIAILIFIVIAIIMKYTKFGREVYAIGGNAQSAMMMGLNVKKTKFKAYVLDGLLAGCGGFLFCLNSCSGFVEQAKGLEMDAISASVIGGTLLSGGVGTPFGTVFGVLIKGTISSLITTQGTLSSWWVRIALSALLCFFIVLQSIIGSMKKKN